MVYLSRTATRRVLLLALLLFCFYGIHVALVQRSFERYLNCLSITFDDFPAEYSEALTAAKQENRAIDYNDYASFHTNDSDAKIPPIIHFIWFERLYDAHLDISQIPTHGSKAPEHCQNYNENFTVITWNATAARDLIAEHYEWFLPTYDGYKHGIQKVDAAKYFVLWHYGGIYMDLDIDCRRPLDPLLQFPAWFPKTTLLGVNNDVFAARRQHPIIGEMTAQLKLRDVDLFFPYLTVYFSTGPQFASDMLKSWFVQGRDGTAYQPGSNKLDSGLVRFYILPDDFYSETYTFFGHSPGGTWHGSDVAVILWFIAHPWVAITILSSPFVCCVGLAIRRRHLERRKANYTRLPTA